MKESRVSYKKLLKLNKNGETYCDYDLSKLTTFRVGGKAKFYVKINTLENFIQVMMYLEQCDCEYYILGNGSNILISDTGYPGVIIQFGGDFDRILVRDNRMECGAGVHLAKAFVYARDESLSGFEDSAGIPASIGGALCMNAQAYEFEMAKIVDYVVAYHNGKIKYFRNTDCEFSYRSSIFQKDKYIILRVGFVLEKSDQTKIMNRYKEILSKRRETQPIGTKNAGCVFKRIEGIIVSKMLDEMGVKQYSCGGAKVSDIHANFIVNEGNATAQDIKNLIDKISIDFESIYNIKLETEVKFLGEFE